jgi:hypothetical protein
MLTKENIAIIYSDIRQALEAVAKKHNLSIAKTLISYRSTGFKLTGEFGDKSELGEINPLFHKDTVRYGRTIGMTVSDIGKTIKIGTRSYEIQGMRGRNWVIGKDFADGKIYKLRPEDVKAKLNKD